MLEYNNWIKEVERLIHDAEDHGMLEHLEGITGYSGASLVGLLQRLAVLQESDSQTEYVEIGVFQGMSLLHVAYCLTSSTAYGIDNFSQFDKDAVNASIIQFRQKKYSINQCSLINMDYEDALSGIDKYIGADKRIGLFFVDGPHDYRSQLMCLELAKPFLSDRAIIVIDDSNYRHVRLATYDFLKINPTFKLVFEAYTASHPANMSNAEENKVRKGWWNGVNILVRDEQNMIEPCFPEVTRDRALYVNDHLVHQYQFARLAPEATYMLSCILSLRPIRLLKSIYAIFRKYVAEERVKKGEFLVGNTYSEKLSRFALHIKLQGLNMNLDQCTDEASCEQP